MGGKFTAIAEVFHDKTTSYIFNRVQTGCSVAGSRSGILGHRDKQVPGVVGTALRRWVDQLRIERDGGTPKGKALTAEQQKIQELEARINRLEREKAILKNCLPRRAAAH